MWRHEEISGEALRPSAWRPAAQQEEHHFFMDASTVEEGSTISLVLEHNRQTMGWVPSGLAARSRAARRGVQAARQRRGG
ncbi:unnamed protein product, partial [Prorocentrum cordatum]